MSEHARTTNPHTGERHQWVDGEVCMVLDTITGDSWRDKGYAIMSTERALDLAGRLSGREGRTVIVRLPAIVAYALDSAAPVSTEKP